MPACIALPLTIDSDPVNILDAVGFIATTLRPDSSVGTQADYDRAAEIVRRVNLHDELVATLREARSLLAAREVIDAEQALAAVLAKVEGR